MSLSKDVSNCFEVYDFYCFSRTVFKQERISVPTLLTYWGILSFFRHVYIPRIEILLPLIVMEKQALFYSFSHFLSDDVTRFVVNWSKTVEMWLARRWMLALKSLLGRGGKYTKLHITGKKRRFGKKKYQLKRYWSKEVALLKRPYWRECLLDGF